MGIAFSTVSAVTELFVTAAVYTFMWQAWRNDRFLGGLLGAALTYEVVVNIAYMTYRMLLPPAHTNYPPLVKGILPWHGLLSLLMFIGLVVMALEAFRLRRHGRNLLRERPRGTLAFAGLWAVSIVSGELIYVLTYL